MGLINNSMSGGRSVSAGSLNPRTGRGPTAQAAAYWSGGGPNFPTLVEYLVVAGGAGGGGPGGNTAGPGGGGAGGARTGNLATSGGQALTVTVGGAGGGNASGSGSRCGSILASGGGVGGSGNGAGTAGGSGGGGSNNSGSGGGAGGAGNAGGYTPTEGANGGAGSSDDNTYRQGGNGGSKSLNTSITGSSVTYSNGGTGGGLYAANQGNQAANTGNGGYAASPYYNVFNPFAGGSGIVVVSYPDSFDNLTSVGAGLTYTLTLSGGKKIYKFTAGTGTVVV
jgi:hypothetical protein